MLQAESWPAWLRALRPQQWTKNAVVLAAFFFALGDTSQHIGPAHFILALTGALLFSMLSSSVYILNDLRDIELDRQHPLKRFRPFAAEELSVSTGKTLAASLALFSLITALILSPAFAGVLLIYLVMQVAYTLKLKTLPLIDVLIIALGFVLRALSGALLIEVYISPWLLICTMLLALLLGLSKRRHEKVVLAKLDSASRPSLRGYSSRLLDLLIGMVSLTTVGAYTMYTLSPETVEKFGTADLIYSTPLVLLGIARYLVLVYRDQKGDRPEKILLSDLPLIGILIAYAGVILLQFLSTN